ncbi:MAG: DsbA family protein [Candidatus Aenigmarchaeota archaeon]|nr:DsbA family protein [Candidatus Aenigmarchaeota archaeon]
MTEEGKKLTIRIPKISVWTVSTFVLIVVLAVFLYSPSIPLSLTGRAVTTTKTLSSGEAAKKAIDYINNNLIQTGQVTLVSVEEFDNMYKVVTSYQGKQIPVYITKGGSYLFVSQPFDTSKPIPKQEEQQQFDAPDKERPEVNLFVMSFCPFGVQAENLMKPVVDLLGKKADIRVRFIANVQGNTVDSVRSLHGLSEAKEDLRQICIMKYYDQKTFWDYLMETNRNCYPIYRDADKLDACWKQAAQKFGIDTSKIETCAYGSEGLNLLKIDEELADQYSVTGSPTLIINGQRYSGTRSSESFKQAICSGFITQPSECTQTLSSSSSTTAGRC